MERPYSPELWLPEPLLDWKLVARIHYLAAVMFAAIACLFFYVQVWRYGLFAVWWMLCNMI